jgi:hypothetical protein
MRLELIARHQRKENKRAAETWGWMVGEKQYCDESGRDGYERER